MISKFRIKEFSSSTSRDDNSKYFFTIHSFNSGNDYLTSIEVIDDTTFVTHCTCKACEIELAKGNPDFKCYHIKDLIELLRYLGEL